MYEPVFTVENITNLKKTCQNIISILDENIDGDLMAAQLMMLGNKISEFGANPIIYTSGCIDSDTLY